MYDMQKKIGLIIPCYNEAGRINIKDFKERSDLFFVFVDDGSIDHTVEIITQHSSENICLHSLKKNSGKAEAVRQGMLAIQRMAVFNNLEWVGFWDADLATPLDEVNRFIRYADLYSKPVAAICGSRVYRLGARIHRSFKRHFWGRVFATVASILLHLDSYDSQCGAKIFRKHLICSLFKEEFLSRWLFDVEILMRLRDLNACVIEYPIQSWRDVKGGKLNIFPELLRVLRDLFEIRSQYCRKK